MPDVVPDWVRRSECRRGWFQVIGVWATLFGAVVVFFLVNYPREKTELALKETQLKVERFLAEQTEARIEQDRRIRNFEEKEKEASATKADLEASKLAKPLIVIRPTVTQSASQRDLREVVVETEVKNMGLTDVEIDDVKVLVFEGSVTADALSILRKTQQMFDLLERSRSPRMDEDPAAIAATEAYQKLADQGCPHGKIFSIGRENGSVTWKALDGLTERVEQRGVLHPGQAALQRFTYVLTEPSFPHDLKWFRFEVTVSSNEPRVHKFEFVLPGMPFRKDGEEGVKSVNYTVLRRTDGSRWEASAPLLPMGE